MTSINGVTTSGDTASDEGGAAYFDSTAWLGYCWVTNNSAADDGGGPFVDSVVNVSPQSDTLLNNRCAPGQYVDADLVRQR